MSFPNKANRESCWNARDRYWECLDANNVGPDSPSPVVCNETRKMFESMCPGQWVKHFDRKRDYNIFKEKLETQGYQAPPDNETSPNDSAPSVRKQKPFKQLVY